MLNEINAGLEDSHFLIGSMNKKGRIPFGKASSIFQAKKYSF